MGKATSSDDLDAVASASASGTSATRRRSGSRESDATGGSLTPTATRDERPQGDRAQGAEAPVSENDEGEGEDDDDDNDDDDEDEEDDDEDEDEEDDDEEPWFKSQSVSKEIRSIYRNGDAASCFVTSGDKMVIGTHNGCIHVISTSSFELVRSYRAHKATVTSISISPFPYSTVVSNTSHKHALETLDEGGPSSETASMFSVRSSRTVTGPRTAVKHAHTSSGTIYVATSSVEGNVCVASLSDPKDVMLRNFGRPVHTVALSPNYSRDRTFLSGGTSGSLVVTVGGRIGGKSDATILGNSITSSSGWLNSLGLSSNKGKDTILHDGEGTINTIKWSQSGKFVMWVNEEGIKVMRSNIGLGNQEADLAWKRLSHIDRPKSSDWNDMAGVWKARAEWVNRDSMETYNTSPESSDTTAIQQSPVQESDPAFSTEKLIVGWGGTIWVVDVSPTESQPDKEPAQRKGGSVSITTILRTNCIISGISLYTPSILLVLAYIEKDEDDDDDDDDDGENSSQQSSRPRGLHHKHNGLQPELRLIDIESKKQIAADPQEISRFETLSSSDYHMGIIPPPRAATTVRPKSTLDTLWDATVVQPTRLISSAASIRSTFSSSQPMHTRRNSFAPTTTSVAETERSQKDAVARPVGSSKIVILTPYDCVFAVKRGLRDRLTWLEERERYEEAWNLIDQHPDAFPSTGADTDDAATITSQDTHSNLNTIDMGLDETLSTLSSLRISNTVASKEKTRIGELWLNQLVNAAEWKAAGEACGKVLKSASQWEHWVTKFTENGRFDEITPYIPANLESPLPSVIYEVLLNHYISVDRFKARELLEQWPSTLFEPTSVIDAIERELPLIDQDSEEWRITVGSLAQLYLASGRYREALKCYIELGDIETTMALISQYHLLEAVGEDIPSIILLHVPMSKITTLPTDELEAATANVIKLLVSGASSGIVKPDTVIEQLRDSKFRVFLYFYIKALWSPEQADSEKPRGRFSRHHGHGQPYALRSPQVSGELRADEGRAVIDNFADVVVEVFATFDRPLLMDFLQSSTAYSFEAASAICDAKHYTRELIYLLSKTGETKRALGLILSDLNDISAAIGFAKQQGDPELWEDLLSYSMDKPDCIRGLLKEAGTIINPIDLVKRIPSGLEIEGLRDGLTHLIREYDIQASISEGVARVLVGEVAMRMEALRKERRRGIKFNVSDRRYREKLQTRQTSDLKRRPNEPLKRVKTYVAAAAPPAEEQTFGPPTEDLDLALSRCAGCDSVLTEGQEHETLIAFGCGHIYHLSHVNLPARAASSRSSTSAAAKDPTDAPDGKKSGVEKSIQERFPPPGLNDKAFTYSRTIGPKVTTARLIRDELRSGCQVCIANNKSTAP